MVDLLEAVVASVPALLQVSLGEGFPTGEHHNRPSGFRLHRTTGSH
jgi:hypothetical protein